MSDQGAGQPANKPAKSSLPAHWAEPATWRVWAAQAAIGALLGLVLVASIFVGEVALGWTRVVEVAAPAVAVPALLLGLGRALFVGVVEEAVFRGVLLSNVVFDFRKAIGTPAAVALSAIVFGAFHAFNANVTPLAIFNLVVAGLLFAMAYLIGRGLALPIGLHAAWNWFEGWVFGFPLSGTPREALLTLDVRGPVWATGGFFGPEGGALGLAAMALTAALLWLVRRRVPRVPAATPAA